MKCCIIPIIEINTLKRHRNVKTLSHNHNQYLLLYKAAEHLASSLGRFILRVPEVEYISYNTGTRALPGLVMYRHPTDHVMRTNASAYTGSMCIVHGLNLEIVGEDFVLTKVIN